MNLITKFYNIVLLLLLASACKPVDQANNLRHLVDKDLSDDKVQKALEADFALKVNLKTNRMSYFKNGKLIDQWNIASADITGEFHEVNGVKEKQFTPTGIYTAHDIEHCPSWLPRKPFNPETKKYVEDPDERWEILTKYADLYGPCGKTNPLGSYALWFSGAYGVHGNSAEWILDLPVEDRRVSGGCIRNPNVKIKSVFEDILKKLPDFKKKVDANLAAAPDEKKTLTAAEITDKVLIHVIVGNWDTDPGAEEQQPGKKECVVKYVSPSTGKLEIYKNNPLKDVIGYYAKGEKVEILETIDGVYRTEKGFVNKHYFGACIEEKPAPKADSNETSSPDKELEDDKKPVISPELEVPKESSPPKDDIPEDSAEALEKPAPESEEKEDSNDETTSKYLMSCVVKYANSAGLLEIWSQVPLANKVGTYSKGQKIDILEKVAGVGNILKTDEGFVNGHYLGDCVNY